MASPTYALGLDYGTGSVRALIVRCEDGAELGTSVVPYAHGQDGVVLSDTDPLFARQHPKDYIDGLFVCVRGAVKEAERDSEFSADRIVGIGVDTTGSTPLPVDENCRPLGLDPRFEDNPAAYAWLWRDHTGYAEAEEITRVSDEGGFPYMKMVGGTYSSEWFWSKTLHCARTSPDVFDAAYSWLEMADFIPAYLIGATHPSQIKKSICAAGHKGLFNPDWGGLPSKEFLSKLDPRLATLRDRLYSEACASDEVAGKLAPEVADKLGLPAGIPVAVGAFDAHMGAVGSGCAPGILVKIVGTSICDIMVGPMPTDGQLPIIPGMCGVVKGSVLPGMLGIEAGQSAVGDLLNWFVKHLVPPEYHEGNVHENLTKAASKLRAGESGLVALDWNNGNRTVLVDQRLTGLIVGQTLSTTAPEIYRALIEAIAFGALTIIRRAEQYGAQIDAVVCCGGIAEKNSLLMQVFADVMNRPMKISRSAQTCALGAAIFGAVAGGRFSTVEDAQRLMTGTKEHVFHPRSDAVAVYRELYRLYMDLHDEFGGVLDLDLSMLMKELIHIRERARAAS